MLRRIPAILAACGHCTRIPSSGIGSQLQRRSFHKTSSILYPSDKDLPVAGQPIPLQKLYPQDTDLLYEELRKAKTIPRLLELVSQHLEVMNNRHIVAVFEVIHASTKRERGRLQVKSDTISTLPDNEIFQALCNHTLDRIRYLEPSNVISVFKALTQLGVHNNTHIIQALLKMICSQINELSLSELIFLNFLLSRQKSGPAVDGLKMALPLVLQVQVENRLDSDNVQVLVDCLDVGSRARMKPTTIQKIISALVKKINVLSGEQAVSVVLSLLRLETPVDGYLGLFNNAFNIATNNMERLRVKQILHVFRKCNKYNFFHGGFLLAAANKAVEDNWNMEECLELQKYMHKMCVFHQELCDLLCSHIISNAEVIKTDAKFSLLHIASYFALTNYCPSGLEKVVQILCSSEEKLSFMYEAYPHFYTRFVSCLTTLGYFPERILQHVLDESFLMRAWSVGRKSGRTAEFEKSLCTLLWSIEAHNQCSQFQVPAIVKKKVVQSVVNRHMQSDNEFPLTKFLDNGLGGSQFFLTGIYSHSGHVIDHVLAMRNGIYPVSLSTINYGVSGAQNRQQITYIEDLRIPDDAKVITIFLANKESYCKEPSGILKSWEKVKCASLNKMNYFPIVISYPDWCMLPDREKIPYLMREIKQAVESENLSRTNLL